MTVGKRDIDAVTGVETTGHEWDGVKELNKPLPYTLMSLPSRIKPNSMLNQKNRASAFTMLVTRCTRSSSSLIP